MPEFKPGDTVQVTEICGHGIPLPAIGVVESQTAEDWFTIRIKWIDHINEQCEECHCTTTRTAEVERICDVRKDWMRARQST